MRGGAIALQLAVLLALGLAHAEFARAEPPAPAPSPSPSPCNAIAAINRPGMGRITATSGAACVVPPGTVLVEFGYRNQTTGGNGASSTLVSYPLTFVHVGVGGGNEWDVLPPAYAVRGGVVPDTFSPVRGFEDAGIGFKHLVVAKARLQGSLSGFVTFPTGRPGGNGLSAGLTTYTVTAAYSYALSPAFTTTLAEGLSESAGPDAVGVAHRFVQNTPSITFALTVAPRTALIAQLGMAAPFGPGAGTGIRSLLAIQRTVIPNRLFIDVDYGANLLPHPGTHSQAIDVGGAIVLGP